MRYTLTLAVLFIFLTTFGGPVAATDLPRSTSEVEVPKIRAAAKQKLSAAVQGEADDFFGCWIDERGQKVCMRCTNDFWSVDVFCFPFFGALPQYTFDGRCHLSQSDRDLFYDCFYRRHAGRFVDAVREKFPEMLRVIGEAFYHPILDTALLWLFDFLPPDVPSTPENYVCALLNKQSSGPHEEGIDDYEEEESNRQYTVGGPRRLFRQIAGAQGVELRARKLADYHRYRLELSHTRWDGSRVVLWADPVMVTSDACNA